MSVARHAPAAALRRGARGRAIRRPRRREVRSTPTGAATSRDDQEAIEYWIEFSPKLRGARSRLYRRRFLQLNTRWTALDAIYKIRILLHRSDFKISDWVKNRQTFFRKWIINYSIFSIFHWIVPFWRQILMKFCRVLEHDEICRESDTSPEKWIIFSENCSKVWKIMKLFNFPIE